VEADFSVAPEIAQLAFASPGPPPAGTLEPTIGAMAALLREFAACPARWMQLVRLEPGGPVTRRVGTKDGRDVRVVVTPPGYRAWGRGEEATVEVLAVVTGELSEDACSAAGVVRRHLVPGKILVRGDRRHWRETGNPGPGYAVSLHVTCRRQAPAQTAVGADGANAGRLAA
jgi:hypothetical protein